MPTAIVLFTRDLRVHDNAALSAACEDASVVVPLFVLDTAILDSSFAAPNRLSVLLDSLHDLRDMVHDRGSELVIRRGRLVDEVRAVIEESGATSVHVSRDWSRHAVARQTALADLCSGAADLVLHQGHLLHEPGTITPTGGGAAFKVFTPYWRHWVERERPEPLPAPDRIPGPHPVEVGTIPELADLTDEAASPKLEPGGEVAARARADVWFDDLIDDYEDGHDRMADPDGTSRLSAHLHFGTISVVELASRIDRRRNGHEAYFRQLCWREFNHQLLAATPSLTTEDWRTQDDQWRNAPDEFAAWKQGQTGYPIVDAGMRQLADEGFMHNRARLLTASFLTKHLHIDWRLGAAHFASLLVDGDIANNWVNWQWVAGTGTDSRPNRVFNPTTQGHRYDPDGTYVRRHVPELASVVDGGAVHEPWAAAPALGVDASYPSPIVDHDEARARFLTARGKTP